MIYGCRKANNFSASSSESADMNTFTLRDVLMSIHQGSTGFRSGSC